MGSGGPAARPSVAIGADGEVLVAWVGNGVPAVVRYRPDGHWFRAHFLEPSTPLAAGFAHVVLADSGVAYVAWERRNERGVAEVRAARRDVDGMWSPPSTVAVTGESDMVALTDLALGLDDTAHVVALRVTSDAVGVVAACGHPTVGWAEPATLAAPAREESALGSPFIAAHASRRVVATWPQGRAVHVSDWYPGTHP